MDIQREREVFEKLPEIARHINKFVFQDDLNCYRNKIKSSDIHLVTWVNGAWYSWQAKAQAVPEGFVLVPEDQAKDTERLNFLLGGEKCIRTVMHRDIQNDEYEKIGEHFQLTEVFWIDGFDYWENTSSDSERGAIDKAMIEAQEPAND